MLVLTRRTGESILIGDDIVITVLEHGRDQVRIGISAPRSVAVHREEVYNEIKAANEAAAAGIDPTGGAPVVAARPAELARRPKRPAAE